MSLYNKKQYKMAIDAFFQCDSLMYIAKGENSNYTGHGKQWIASCFHKMGNDSIAKKLGQYYYLEPIELRQTIVSDSLLDIAEKLYDNGKKKEAVERFLEASKIEKRKCPDALEGENCGRKPTGICVACSRS